MFAGTALSAALRGSGEKWGKAGMRPVFIPYQNNNMNSSCSGVNIATGLIPALSHFFWGLPGHVPRRAR